MVKVPTTGGRENAKRKQSPGRRTLERSPARNGDPGKSVDRETRIRSAMSAMEQDRGLVYTNAVRMFDVKRSTLHDHMSKKCVKFTKGRFPLLSTEEELCLLEMLKNLQTEGYDITPRVCRRAAYRYAQLCNYFSKPTSPKFAYPLPSAHGTSPTAIPCPPATTVDINLVGRKWFAAFVKRNNVEIRTELS